MGNNIGRPVLADGCRKMKQLHFMLTAEEFDKVKMMSKGFSTLSDFVRTRLFYDSTFQQVQPEEFIAALNQMTDELKQTKNELSRNIDLLEKMQSSMEDNEDFERLFESLFTTYKEHLKNEKKMATYISRMLNASRRTKG